MLPNGRIWRKKKNHWKDTYSHWYWEKGWMLCKGQKYYRKWDDFIIKLTISVLLVSLHVQTHLFHCRLTKTNWEITKFLFKSCTLQPTQLPNYSSSFLPYSCFLAQLLPPCRVLLIPLLFRLSIFVCMLDYYDRSVMASSELYVRSIFVGVNIFEHCHLISVKPLGRNYISTLHKHKNET